MFSFFRKKSAGKSDQAAEKAETYRNHANNDTPPAPTNPVTSRASSETNEKANTRKDVVNLLIPETDYSQKTGVGAIFHNIMAGKKRKNKKNNKIARAESCREISPQKEMPPHPSLQRSVSDLESTYKQCDLTRNQDVSAPTAAKNITDAPQADPADFVRALVLQKYANKSPIETKKSHVSLVYVNEPNIDEKKHAETLLREIAKSIDCTIDKINEEKKLMGATDSKTEKSKRNDDPVYESIMEKPQEQTIESLKDGLKDELEKLLKENSEVVKSDDDYVSLKGDDDDDKLEIKEEEDKPVIKKSNLKPPRSDTEGCSDDDRSDCGKKRVTFRKVIVFDDGDEQTDQEMDSSFESLTSEESEEDSEAEDEDEEETDEDEAPDNDEMLGGVVVSRNNNENKTVISNINETADSVTIKIECSDDDFKRISSDNSDSGFIEISDKLSDSIVEISSKTRSDDDSSSSECSGSEAEEIVEVEDTDEEEDDKEVQEERVVIEEIFESEESEESEEAEEVTDEDDDMSEKTLVTQESKFQSQVSALTELADHRCDETEKARDLIAQYRKEIEQKDLEIESLKSELAKAYKESELVKQRSRSLEEELGAARSCSANLAEQLTSKNDETIRQLREDLEAALVRAAELESRVVALERERDRLQQDKRIQEQRAQEALATAEANTTKWRLAHESARSQAAARAERMLADCEWKMRELEKRAREAERNNYELTQSIETIKTEKPKITAAAAAEVSQLRGLLSEQQRSVQSLTLTLQKVETREEALKLEVHRLKELLEKECRISKEKENRHLQTIERLEQQHVKAIETVKAETSAAAASTRAALERMHAERTRTALAQLRAEAERDTKNADRKLREVTTRYENLKEELAEKRAHFEQAIAEANSKADWELLNLRHMLDKSDITYANNIERANEKFEKEKEQIIEEWTIKLEEAEEQAETDKEDARRLLEQTKRTLIAEKNEMIQKLKEQHKNEMDEQWERFMSDKEMCLARMKAECRQEGEEERVKREKELLEEIQELRSEMQSKHVDFDTLAVKAAACGRTLAVTEQELREALEREKDMREKRSEDATKMKQIERASKDQVEHLTRKCACLRKLFDDIRARLTMREREHAIETKTKDREIQQLRAEVARLTKLLMEQSVGAASLGARTMADGCEDLAAAEGAKPNEKQPSAPRRKGGTKTPEPIRKRPTLPELPALPPESRLSAFEESDGRKRSKSVDLPAVQVPTRIRQLEEKGIIH